jgi:hypothetical protein
MSLFHLLFVFPGSGVAAKPKGKGRARVVIRRPRETVSLRIAVRALDPFVRAEIDVINPAVPAIHRAGIQLQAPTATLAMTAEFDPFGDIMLAIMETVL